MNEMPPKIPISKSLTPKASKPLTSKHLMFGIAGGFMGGVLAGTLFWVFIGAILLSRHADRPPPPQVQDEIVQTQDSDPATIAEIDAAAQLSFENNKLAQFNQLAGRGTLSPAAQAHLVEMTFQHLSFENNVMQVLLKLIGNPSFSSAAKTRILKDLSRISFENNKQQLLDAMGKRENQQ